MDHAGRTSAERVRHEIDERQADLWSNLEALEHKFKSATDWQRQFRKNPIPILGVAFGGGVCLAALAGRRAPHHQRNYAYRAPTRGASPARAVLPTYASHKQVASSAARERALHTLETAKGALIAVAAMHFKKYVEQILPGFQEQYDKAAGTSRREAS